MRVAPGSPAFESGLGKDDEIIFVNDVKVENNLQALLTHFHAAVVTLKVSTPMKKLKSIALELSHEQFYPEYKLVKAENPSTTQQKFFNEWMKSSVSKTYTFMNWFGLYLLTNLLIPCLIFWDIEIYKKS